MRVLPPGPLSANLMAQQAKTICQRMNLWLVLSRIRDEELHLASPVTHSLSGDTEQPAGLGLALQLTC
jgi:hypothetical protein